jgi:hypothetical protein
LYLGYTFEWNNHEKVENMSDSLQSSTTSDKFTLLSVPKIVLFVPKLNKQPPDMISGGRFY